MGCILNLLLVGVFVDWIFAAGWFQFPILWYWQYPMLLAGVVLSGWGAGMYIAAKWGAGPRDGLMIILSERSGLSIRTIKTFMEITVLTAGYFMGGPVAIGTLIFSVLIGPVIQTSIRLCRQAAFYMYHTPGEKQRITVQI